MMVFSSVSIPIFVFAITFRNPSILSIFYHGKSFDYAHLSSIKKKMDYTVADGNDSNGYKKKLQQTHNYMCTLHNVTLIELNFIYQSSISRPRFIYYCPKKKMIEMRNTFPQTQCKQIKSRGKVPQCCTYD